MQDNMPGLDTQKLVSILNDLPEERPPTEDSGK